MLKDLIALTDSSLIHIDISLYLLEMMISRQINPLPGRKIGVEPEMISVSLKKGFGFMVSVT